MANVGLADDHPGQKRAQRERHTEEKVGQIGRAQRQATTARMNSSRERVWAIRVSTET